MLVTHCQCIIGTEKYPDAGLLLNYEDDEYSQGYTQIKETFRALTEDDILQPYISKRDFRSSNVRADDIAYNLYVFDIRYHQISTGFQPIKVEIKFDGAVPIDSSDYDLVSTN